MIRSHENNGWLKVPIKDISEVLVGFAWDSKRFNYNGEGLPVIRIQNLEANTNAKSAHWTDDFQARYLTDNGDILISLSGSFKVDTWSGPKALLNQRIAKLVPDTSKVLRSFFLICLKRQIASLASQATQTSVANVSIENLKNTIIPLPPLPIQRQIATILEKADAAREKRRKANELTNQFLQSAFLEMFGDPVTNPMGCETRRLQEVATIVMGQSPPGGSYNSKSVGTPLLNGPTEFGIRSPKEAQWTIEPSRLCRPGDILFCVRGATAGRMNWADKEYCIGRGLAAIRPMMSSEFVYSYLLTKYRHFQSIGQGSTFINISKEMLGELSVPVPTHELQRKFTSVAGQIEGLTGKQKVSEDGLDMLFQSLMQLAFQGELCQ